MSRKHTLFTHKVTSVIILFNTFRSVCTLTLFENLLSILISYSTLSVLLYNSTLEIVSSPFSLRIPCHFDRTSPVPQIQYLNISYLKVPTPLRSHSFVELSSVLQKFLLLLVFPGLPSSSVFESFYYNRHNECYGSVLL